MVGYNLIELKLLGCKLVNKWVKDGNWFGIWYGEPNDGSWLTFEVMEFADVGVFELEEDDEFELMSRGPVCGSRYLLAQQLPGNATNYTESSPDVRPIGLREPKYSPFGPGKVDRVWTGVCAPAVDPRRDGLTHNMLNDIHNNWKQAEAVRIKCMGVPTVDMKNVCAQLEDKAFGKIIHRHGGSLILYRGRNYNPKKRPVIPLMLWKPQEPIYPKLIKTTIEGLSIEETKEMRKKGLAVPALTKLAKNGYYGGLVPMIRDAFLVEELVRIDCQGLEKKDYKKLGAKLRDLVPCILVAFEKEQIVIWRGKDYKPKEGGCFLMARESFDNSSSDADPNHEGQDVSHDQIESDSCDENSRLHMNSKMNHEVESKRGVGMGYAGGSLKKSIIDLSKMCQHVTSSLCVPKEMQCP
ncbi:RNA-binding CRS1 / YhbY (CRM) domain-containing protein [Artemisia annua]|uniref:RNA-binding CRS1 / YhbY (CRM) domain-containing protein n=1 Tax=Artemisia annua TaxID=35608 RepID=A0A2U1LQC1_ARTAN|nr:RNA-binding CRS1 / YhbY (CRM) domain-containing protein [Artemisia annua]